MRVTDLDFVTVRVEDVSIGETFKLFPWQPGQLAVGERGYCNPRGIRAVVERGADVVLFTTVPKSRRDAELCLALDRLRWQIELLFKRWKSLCGFDRPPNYLDETITAWIYAKVLLALLMQRMGASALSPPEPSPTPRRRRATASLGTAVLEARLDPLAHHRLGAVALRSA